MDNAHKIQGATIEILETQIYRGANLWAPVRAIRFLLDSGEFEERPINRIRGFYAQLTTPLPTMKTERCSVGRRGGFFERVKDGTWMGHELENTALELQILAGQHLGYDRARTAYDSQREPRHGIYHVVFQFEQGEAVAASSRGARMPQVLVYLVVDAVHGERPNPCVCYLCW